MVVVVSCLMGVGYVFWCCALCGLFVLVVDRSLLRVVCCLLLSRIGCCCFMVVGCCVFCVVRWLLFVVC